MIITVPVNNKISSIRLNNEMGELKYPRSGTEVHREQT
jgi:hypothetical protein